MYGLSWVNWHGYANFSATWILIEVQPLYNVRFSASVRCGSLWPLILQQISKEAAY